MTSPILVPTDGSPEAERALGPALLMAQAYEAPICLFWSWERPPDLEEVVTPTVAVQIEKRELADRRDHLEALGERVCAPAGVEWSTAVVVGEPEETIIEQADAVDAAMVVMATHGRSGFKRWRLGSVADRVVRTSGRPTLLIHPEEGVPLPQSIETVLAPLDGSERAEGALNTAIGLAEATGATLRLLRIAKLLAPIAAVDYGAGYQDLDRAAESAAHAYLDDVKAALTSVPVETRVLLRDPSSGIIEEAQTADIVVMSSHGRGGLLRMALGSVTDAVIRGGGKPVLVVPSPDD